MPSQSAFLLLAALSLAAPSVLAQSPGVLLQDGDPVFGVGSVDRIQSVAITDLGSWSVVVEAGFDFSRDKCLLLSGFLALREGMALPLPVGSTVRGWGSNDLASNGDLGLVLEVDLSGTTDSVDYLFWNLSPIVGENEILTGPGFGPNTTLDSVRVARVTADRTVIALMKVENPTVAPGMTDALMRFRIDAQGNVLSREVLATRRTQNDTLDTFIEELGSPTSPEHSLSVNQRGDFVLPVNGFGRKVIMKNLDTIVAQELQPSPVAGRSYAANAFALSKCAINDRGDIVFSANLTPIGPANEPTTLLIVKNGQKFSQSGDVIPALSASALGKATVAVFVSNRGDVFWRAQPTTTAGAGAAFMKNYTPLIQESVTVVEGNPVYQVTAANECFAVSPNGRFFLGRVVLQTVGDAVLFIDFGLISELPGCLGVNQGTLRHLSGEPRIGQTVRVGMDEGPVPGALPFVFL